MDLIANRTFPQKGSLLFISEILKADNSGFIIIRSLGGRQYR